MKCIIYLRVSTKEQAQTNESEGYSISAQRKACTSYILDKGWELVDEFTDRGESARSAHRPQLQEMLSRIKKQKDIDAVVVHKIDRLARNLEDHVAIKAILTKAECSLVSVVENIEDTASGKLVEGIHAIVAEFYSANLAAEVKKGMLEKVKQGGWPHQAPLGYLNVREGTRNIATVVIDPETSPHVVEAFELYATGNYSLHDIKDFLFDKGIRNRYGKPGPLALDTIRNIFNNPFFYGTIRYMGAEYTGEHKPLISRQLFEKVQNQLDERRAGGTRRRKHPHYLKGSLYCGHCGGRLSYLLAKGKYPYFFCLNKQKSKNKDCQAKYVEVAVVEEEVEKIYKKIQLSKEAADRLIDRFTEELVSKQSTNAMEEKFLAKRIGKLADERLGTLRAFHAKAIPLDLLKQEQDRIASEMSHAESRLEVIHAQLDQLRAVLDRAIAVASRCGMGYKKAKPHKRKLYNQAFFEKIIVKDGKIKVEYTDLFQALLSESSNKTSLVGPAGLEPATGRL